MIHDVFVCLRKKVLQARKGAGGRFVCERE